MFKTNVMSTHFPVTVFAPTRTSRQSILLFRKLHSLSVETIKCAEILCFHSKQSCDVKRCQNDQSHALVNNHSVVGNIQLKLLYYAHNSLSMKVLLRKQKKIINTAEFCKYNSKFCITFLKSELIYIIGIYRKKNIVSKVKNVVTAES